MPELPEVETIVNGLKPCLSGLRFTAVKVYDTRPIQGLSVPDFSDRLLGREVLDITRRGKFIIIKLSGGDALIIHLRMTGALLFNPTETEPFKRVVFYLDDGSELVYTDIRRFGTISLVKSADEITAKLGIEPLSHDFTQSALANILKRYPGPVKNVLLNQERIAGIGNMYADEALFAAGIHPLTPAGSLNARQAASLHKSIRMVLKKAISQKGASIRNYRHPDGGKGTAHNEFAVAHRKDKPCPHCGTAVSRTVVGQRGTYFCPRCQQL